MTGKGNTPVQELPKLTITKNLQGSARPTGELPLIQAKHTMAGPNANGPPLQQPRLTQEQWNELDEHLEGFYDWVPGEASNELYAPSPCGTRKAHPRSPKAVRPEPTGVSGTTCTEPAGRLQPPTGRIAVSDENMATTLFVTGSAEVSGLTPRQMQRRYVPSIYEYEERERRRDRLVQYGENIIKIFKRLGKLRRTRSERGIVSSPGTPASWRYA